MRGVVLWLCKELLGISAWTPNQYEFPMSLSKLGAFCDCTGDKQYVMGLVWRSSLKVYQLLYLFSSSKAASFRDTRLLFCNQIPCALIWWKLICTRFALIEVSRLVNIKWFYRVSSGMSVGYLCSALASSAHGSHACLEKWLLTGPSNPLSGDFLSHNRGACGLRKIGAFRSQSPLPAPPWGMGTIWPSWNYD